MSIAQGTIPISEDGGDQGSTSTPTVKLSFKVDVSEASDLSEIRAYWEVENAIKIDLIVQKVEYSTTYQGYIKVDAAMVYDVTMLSEVGYLVALDNIYSTEISVKATNSIGTEKISDPQIIRNAKSNNQVVGAIYNSDSGFSIEREANTFNLVKGKITLDKIQNFDFNLVTSIQLLYKNEIASSWTPITLDKGPASVNEIKNDNKDVSGYSIIFNKIKINVPSIGSAIFFLVKTTATGLGDYFSKEQFLFFDSMDLGNSANPSNTVPDLIINQKKPAALRYEIKLKISETYKQSENATYIKGAESGKYENSFLHLFSDFEKFKGNTSSQELVANLSVDGEIFTGFYYEATSKKSTSNNYRGFVYPACVSEILPCINIIKDQSDKTTDVILFWKIIEDFYDYSFLNNEIRIATTDLQVSVQYYDGSAYQTISKEVMSLKIGNKNNYNIDEDKFVLKLTRDSIVPAYLSLFDNISNLDNKNANLKIKIEKHNVTCYSPFRSVDYSFNNLLLPPRWSYLVYDEFIRSGSRDYATNTISFNLEDYALRGIRLPDRAFREFDKIQGMVYLETDNQGGTAIVTQTVKVLYKLTSQTVAFYTDPIREGTITYIDLPVKPDEVFLIAPKVQIPNPNIDSNGKPAKAEVILNEYGKISGLKIIDPGYGYSMFKTENDKRIQVFSDLNPTIKSSYKILSTKRTEIPEFLKPINNSFSRLKASLYGGKPLSQVGSNNAVLDDQEAKILQDYLARNNIKEQNLQDQTSSGSGSTYINTNSNPEDETSMLKLDPFWYQISKLYVDKHNNPLENVSIYNEDTDAAVTEIEDSSISNTVNSSSSAIEGSDATVLNENFSSTVRDGQTFSLSNLDIYTDASPAVSIHDTAAGPPSLTLLPLESRADGASAYGTLPNMLPRASSFFNRLVDGINNLNEVRLIVPMVWAVDYSQGYKDYYLPDSETDEYKIINFSTAGNSESSGASYSYYVPINSILSVSASRTVSRSYITRSNAPEVVGEAVNRNYIISSEFGGSLSFTPIIHPWMEKALQSNFLRNIHRKYLALETRQIYSCSSVAPYQENGMGFITCNGAFGVGDTYPRAIPADTNVPVDVSSQTRNFKFFSSGTISESPSGTASTLALRNGIFNGLPRFCSENCGTFTTTALDFTYSSLYPATIKI